MKNTLLVVGNDLRNVYDDVVKRNDYLAHLATSGEEALKFLEENNDVKAILLDLTCPSTVMTGDEFYTQVRTQPQWRHVKFLVMSDWSGLPRRSAQMGADDYAMKPAKLAQLEEQLHHLMRS